MSAEPIMLTLTSPAFLHGRAIPRGHTADGRNVSPPLIWSPIPPGTQEWVLIVEDPDVPRAEPWVHWLLYKIPAQTTTLAEGISPAERVSNPPGAVQGRNSWGRVGYGGPEPPKGHGLHHYHFMLFAVDQVLDLPPRADKKALATAMSGHILADGRLVGTYQR